MTMYQTIGMASAQVLNRLETVYKIAERRTAGEAIDPQILASEKRRISTGMRG